MSDDFDPGALFQIEEPTAPAASKRAPGRGIGIDLGTTHSLVALAPHGQPPREVKDARGDDILPSVVSYVGQEVVVGAQARAAQVANPTRVISSVKRFMGRGRDEVGAHPYPMVAPTDDGDKVVRFDMGAQRAVTPMEVSAEILRVLKTRAEAELGESIDGAVITVPAYFDDAQRQATKDAGRIAGLKVYRLLAEPTAAALAYGLDQTEGGKQGLFAIYDLGGGTFDISILRLREGVFQVLATGGDSALGGDDFDHALATHLLEAASVQTPTAQQREEALAAARSAKERLSDAQTVSVDVPTCGLHGFGVTREVFEALIDPIVRRTVKACRQTLKDADVGPTDLHGVVLVGGSTRVPKVRAVVEKTFKRSPLCDLDPDRVVAYGAAIQADILSGSAREGVTLLDVVPLSLGIETMGGIVEQLIPRNATIPIGARQVFTNYSEQQTGMVFHVVQGERELATDCRSLAKFELRGIPQLPPSMARVEVAFQLDADALLTVTAKELMTGVKQTVEVKPTYGLDEAAVDALVMESLDNAEADFEARNLAEGRVEAGRVSLAVRTALEEVGHIENLLPAEERELIVAALVATDEAMANPGGTPRELKTAREHLESVSEAFARRRMERALLSGMEGKSLGEIESTLAAEEALEERRGSHTPQQT